jgi:hypothetical protein
MPPCGDMQLLLDIIARFNMQVTRKRMNEATGEQIPIPCDLLKQKSHSEIVSAFTFGLQSLGGSAVHYKQYYHPKIFSAGHV